MPNTIGRISFSFAGTSNYPTPFISETNIREGGRFFICFQRRDLSDTSLPIPSKMVWLKRWIDRHYFQKTGDFQFIVLFKRSEDQTYVRGKVFIYIRDNWNVIQTDFKKKMQCIKKINDQNITLPSFFGDKIFSSSSAVVDFKLSRDGTYTTSIDHIDTQFIDTTGQNKSTLEHIVCAQGYFFIRDIFHKHRFHAPSTDTILDLYTEAKNWKKSVNYALARKAIALRRQGSLESIEKASGIITYLKSFRENIMSEKEKNSEPRFQLNAFMESLKSGKSMAEIKEKQSIKAHIVAYMDWILAFVGIIFTYTQLVHKKFIDTSESFLPVNSLVEAFRSNAAITLIMTVCIIFVLKFILIYKPNEKEDFSANIARLSLANDRHVFPAVIFSLGFIATISAIALTGYIFYIVLSVKT